MTASSSLSWLHESPSGRGGVRQGRHYPITTITSRGAFWEFCLFFSSTPQNACCAHLLLTAPREGQLTCDATWSFSQKAMLLSDTMCGSHCGKLAAKHSECVVMDCMYGGSGHVTRGTFSQFISNATPLNSWGTWVCVCECVRRFCLPASLHKQLACRVR